MPNCIFCKIVLREIPSLIVAETDQVLVFKDINPKASIHDLIIPKKHISDIQSLSKQDGALMGEIILMAQQLARELSGSQSFRLVSNNGPAVQLVSHLHFHFLAGKNLPDF